MRFLFLMAASVLGFAASGGIPVEAEPGKILRERVSWRPVVTESQVDCPTCSPGVRLVAREPLLERIQARRAFERSRVVEPVSGVCLGRKCRNAVSSVRTRSRGFLRRLFGR